MANYTILEKTRWYIYADGKEITICHSKEEADQLFDYIAKNHNKPYGVTL